MKENKNWLRIYFCGKPVCFKIEIEMKRPGAVACTYNPATLEAEFRNGVRSMPVGGNSPSIGGWIVWPPVIQH